MEKGRDVGWLRGAAPEAAANRQRRLGVGALILVMASLTLAVHVAVNLVGGYGYARDELYYIACSEHLGAGYVDHPPFSIFVLALFRALFGSSLFAIRLSAGLAGAAAVAFTGLLVRELGGGRRARLVGVTPPSSEAHQLAELPQHWADMFGWEEKARDVARVFASLDVADRAKAAIFASNYGRCGAIDFFGPRYGLPRSIGGHNSYWLWGPREYTGELVIVLGGQANELTALFESVDQVATSSCRHGIPYENDLPFFICRRSRKPLRELWPLAKQYG